MSAREFIEVVDIPAVEQWISTTLYEELRRANVKVGLTQADVLYGLVCALVAYSGMIKLEPREAADVVSVLLGKMETMLAHRDELQEMVDAMDKPKH